MDKIAEKVNINSEEYKKFMDDPKNTKAIEEEALKWAESVKPRKCFN